MEQQIKMAAKLYKMRDTAKSFYGSGYQEKIADYKRFIKAAMAKHKLDSEIQAAMKLAEDVKDVQDSGMGIMLIFAACVELIEPSK